MSSSTPAMVLMLPQTEERGGGMEGGREGRCSFSPAWKKGGGRAKWEAEGASVRKILLPNNLYARPCLQTLGVDARSSMELPSEHSLSPQQEAAAAFPLLPSAHQ